MLKVEKKLINLLKIMLKSIQLMIYHMLLNFLRKTKMRKPHKSEEDKEEIDLKTIFATSFNAGF